QRPRPAQSLRHRRPRAGRVGPPMTTPTQHVRAGGSPGAPRCPTGPAAASRARLFPTERRGDRPARTLLGSGAMSRFTFALCLVLAAACSDPALGPGGGDAPPLIAIVDGPPPALDAPPLPEIDAPVAEIDAPACVRNPLGIDVAPFRSPPTAAGTEAVFF